MVAGLPADVVNFSLAPDVDAPGVGGPGGKELGQPAPLRGMVTHSVVVLAVRKGNPKHITGWNDLIKPGIDVITPNPFTSGGARWNIMAAYGAQLHQGKTSQQAINYLKSLFAHVSVQNASAREELQTFLSGKGDVMIDYEDDVITAQRSGCHDRLHRACPDDPH